MYVQDESGKILKPRDEIKVPARSSDLKLDSVPIVSVISSGGTKLDLIQECGTHIAVLGDRSGSMGAAGHMDLLKRTFQAAIDDVHKLGRNIALCAWDDQLDWFDGKKDWVNKKKYPAAMKWVQALGARGGTQMKPAVNEAASLPNVSDIVTLCDGDFDDFTISSFKAFADNFPRLRFHFVAIGASSDTSKMSQMARDGRGVFFQEI